MGSQGTMGQWDIPKSPWTFYGKGGQLRDISSRVTISIFLKKSAQWQHFFVIDMKSGEFVDSKMLICRTTINLFVCYSISVSYSNSTCQ